MRFMNTRVMIRQDVYAVNFFMATHEHETNINIAIKHVSDCSDIILRQH